MSHGYGAIKIFYYNYYYLLLNIIIIIIIISKVVYKGDCSCGVDYIGETVRNLAVRIAEHSNPTHTSEPAKHLRENPSHSFTWRVLSSAQTFHKRRNGSLRG